MSKKRSVTSDLAEVELTAKWTGNRYSLHAYVNIGKATVEDEKGRSVDVHLRRAELHILPEGVNICPDERLGTENKSESHKQSVSEKIKTDSVVGMKGEASATLSLSPSSLAAKAAASGQASVSHTVSKSQTASGERVEIISNVTARPNGLWEIKDRHSEYLSGRYISIEEPLCHLNQTQQPNRQMVTARLQVRQRDIKFDLEGFKLPLSNTDAKLFGILSTKSAEQGLGNQYAGKLTIAEHEHDVTTDDQ